MRRLVAATVLGLTFAVACTGDPPPPPPPTTPATFVLDSVPPVLAVLTAGDLPVTYALRANVDPRTRLDAADCADSAAGLVTATGDDIVLPDGTIVTQSVSIGDPVVVDEACVAAAARRVVETQIAAVPGTPRDVEVGEPAVSRFPVPRSVDGVLAFEATVPIAIDGLDATMYVDVVTIRDEGTSMILTARRPSTPPSMSDLETIARAAAHVVSGDWAD